MDKVRWGLIGAGDIVRKRVGPALRDLPTCEFVSLGRSRSDLAEGFALEFGVPKWFSDWRELVADPDIDAVYIATPVFLHAAQTIAAANAGKHVLCEKPMALNAAECEAMITACSDANVRLGIAYYRRFYPVLGRVREIIESGEIGRVSVAQINAFEYLEMSDDDPRHWFLEKAKSGGGPMMDFGCHRIEVLTSIFGKVNCVESLVSDKMFNREVEDTAVALLQFESGVCGNITITHASREPQDTLHIFGTKGSLHIESLNSGEVVVKSEVEERSESHPPDPNFHAPLIEDFIRAIMEDREPAVTGADGLEVQSLIEKIYEISY